MRASYKTAGPCHLLFILAALTTPKRPQSGGDGLSHLKEDTGEPSVPAREFNLVSCRNLTRHAGSSESVSPLSHGGRFLFIFIKPSSFPLEIGLHCFQAGYCKTQLNLSYDLPRCILHRSNFVFNDLYFINLVVVDLILC